MSNMLFLAISSFSVEKPLFSDKIERGLDWIYSIQDESGGWPAVKPADTLGCWSTAEMIYTICFIEKDIRIGKIEKGIRFLIDKQIPNKGWPLIGLPPSSTLTTSDAILAFQEALPLIEDKQLYRETKESQKTAIDWMKSHQNEDGGWGVEPEASREGATSRVIATFNATRALYAIGENYRNSKSIQKAVKFIEKIRSKEGAWTVTEESDDPPDVASTAYALLVLLGSKKYDKDSKIIKEGIQWIRQNSTVELLWNMIGEDVVLPSGKVTLHYNTTVNVLWSLLSAECIDSDTLYAIDWLANEQEKGGNWELKELFTGKKLNMSTYITADAILTLFMAEKILSKRIDKLYNISTGIVKSSEFRRDRFQRKLDDLKEKIEIDEESILILKKLPYNFYISKNFSYILSFIWAIIILALSVTTCSYIYESSNDIIFNSLVLFYSYLIVIPCLFLARWGMCETIKNLSSEQFVLLFFVIILGIPGLLVYII